MKNGSQPPHQIPGGPPVEPQLDRIERKLDTLIAALADEHDQEEDPNYTLDGVKEGGERDQTQSLG